MSAVTKPLRSAATSVTAGASSLPAGWASQVITQWFDKWTMNEWFKGGEAVDKVCRDDYLGLYRSLAAQIPDAAWNDPDSALASIIVLDQFPRNIFRGTAQAFATDAQALSLSKNAVTRGLDKDLDQWRKLFMYMPHMHSEDMADQETCIRLLQNGCDPKTVGFADSHVDIIRKFGRFPHRNKCLGRANTAEEEEFLKSHEGFGQ